jgi:hypothetical protein
LLQHLKALPGLHSDSPGGTHAQSFRYSFFGDNTWFDCLFVPFSLCVRQSWPKYNKVATAIKTAILDKVPAVMGIAFG